MSGDDGAHPGALRLRFGVALFACSWLPVAQLIIWLAGLSGDAADKLRACCWTIQFLIGLLGIWLAGSTTIKVAKGLGYRRAPAALWHMLLTGTSWEEETSREE